MPEAACSTHICETLGTYVSSVLENDFGVPKVKSPAPFGISWTDNWLREVAKYTGTEDKVEEVIESEHKRIAPELEKLKEKLDKLRIYSVPVYFNYDVTELRNTNEVLIRHIEEEVNALPPHQYLTVMMGVLVTEKNAYKRLHNQTTQRLMRKLQKYRNVSVFTVPYII